MVASLKKPICDEEAGLRFRLLPFCIWQEKKKKVAILAWDSGKGKAENGSGMESNVKMAVIMVARAQTSSHLHKKDQRKMLKRLLMRGKAICISSSDD
jgi:hypothetical protein